MLSPIERLSYAARQGARIAWYMGHYFASQRFRRSEAADKPEPPPRRQGPSRETILAGMGRLFARDLANVERGYYPLPRDHDGDLRAVIDTSRHYFADLPIAAERRQARRADEVAGDVPDAAPGDYPDYFLQNFHYQTGGYLTEESAKLYDMQVEVLFSGTANAMRRQCLVPIAQYLKGKDQRKLKLLDVACGTGRFLRFAKEAFPRLGATGADLSAAYLDEARRHLKPYTIATEVALAEALPFADASFDIVTSIYLFHELPPEIRRAAAREFARVIKPQGLLVFMDSLQLGDEPAYDAMLKSFPGSFHEPYYATYIAEDLGTIFADAGLKTKSAEPVFLSKMVVCERSPSC
jgi:ubiquinone/menaquinone biosynthesis C-methylase UbiE